MISAVPNVRLVAQRTGRATPDEWAQRLSAAPDFSSTPQDWPGGLLRQWTNTAPEMDQPPLDHHYVVQHLGGAKQVNRHLDGAPVSKSVECGALTIVPAGTRFRWHTQGPIKFAHLYLSPELLADVAFRVDHANEFALVDRVGFRDALLESLYAEMIAAARQTKPPSAIYMDALLDAFVIRLLVGHSTARLRAPKGREVLAKHQRARVLEFIDANLDQTLSLSNLAQVAGNSVFHFSRAFKNSVGEPPHRYVLQRRIARAKSLLSNTSLSLSEIALDCGFHDPVHLTRTFVRLVGLTPSQYRRS